MLSRRDDVTLVDPRCLLSAWTGNHLSWAAVWHVCRDDARHAAKAAAGPAEKVVIV
jgi:hypothetical protein